MHSEESYLSTRPKTAFLRNAILGREEKRFL